MENFFAEPEVAARRWEQALEISRRIGDERNVAILLQRLAHTAVRRGELTRARALAEESRAGFRRVGHRRGEAYVTWNLAEIARAEGDLEGALELLHESRRASEETGFRWWLAGMLANIGAVSLELGRVDDARRNAREALALSRVMDDRKALVYELGLLAEACARGGDSRLAGTLWGAAEVESERTWTGRWLHGTVEPERVLAHADDAFELGRAEGRQLDLDTAVAIALRDDHVSASPGRS
jgi:tetratricopeptide (TPR) repeat protein